MDFLPEQEDFTSFSLLCSLTLQDGCDSCITQSLPTFAELKMYKNVAISMLIFFTAPAHTAAMYRI